MEWQRQSECPSLKRLSAACRKQEDRGAVFVPTCEERRADRRSVWSAGQGPSCLTSTESGKSSAGTSPPLSWGCGLWGCAVGKMLGPPATPRSSGVWPFFQATQEEQEVRAGPRTPSLESHPHSERCWFMSVSPRLVTGAPWASRPGLTTGQDLGGSPLPVCSPHS